MALTNRIRPGSTDMTTGNPYKLIILFSIPLLIGNVFQQLYNMLDSIVVGNFIGEKALAAVGTGFPIIFMLSSLFTVIGSGATVMIAQFYGARDIEKVNQTVGTIYSAMLVGIVPLSLLGIVTTRPLLKLIQVPDDGTLDMAVLYMIVIYVGLIGSIGFNINYGILQGLGDSRSSLIFLLIATIVNIVLDLLFTLAFRWGVFGVALATIIAQLCSWLFGVWYINKHYDFVHISLRRFFFDKKLFREAMRLGIPAGIQQALFSVGMMLMQSLVNGYGSAFMAGFNGANKLDTFAFMPIQSFTTAMTTYTGQNIGACDLKRVKDGTRSGLVICVGFAVVISIILFPLSPVMMRLFSSSQEVIDAGVAYLHTVLPFYFLLAIVFMYNSILRGTGEMMVPMISSFLALWLARLPAAYLLAYFFGKEAIFYSYGIGWLIGGIISACYYYSGRWKGKSVVRHTEKT